MSLSTIFNKVAGSDYTVSTLRDDMELIRQNAHTFCKDSYPAIVARADQLMHLFNAELEMVSYTNHARMRAGEQYVRRRIVFELVRLAFRDLTLQH